MSWMTALWHELESCNMNWTHACLKSHEYASASQFPLLLLNCRWQLNHAPLASKFNFIVDLLAWWASLHNSLPFNTKSFFLIYWTPSVTFIHYVLLIRHGLFHMDNCLIFTACRLVSAPMHWWLELTLTFVSKCINQIHYYLSLLRLSSKIGKSRK